MTEDPQRNFRSAYYEKVGFRGVEEKKSLEILLKDNPLGMLLLLLSVNIKVYIHSNYSEFTRLPCPFFTSLS